ncbi:DUF302 domain-containing protein [Pacificibacter marinus]|uniref:DUF302 domain-containing protein n=1 Tax=Pacificibacter marinus TaxID=658057 RepID=UPI001C075C47|nr:DUF302 domain-containing protein [Pacificibacter marinus]MBU2866955.1 DUF302 domain-containing protein [Pacificibacter marinus]
MKTRILTATVATALSLAAALPAAAADLISVPSHKTVSETLDALEVVLGNAGATVFARIDHAAGAASIDAELRDTQVLIFGNPNLGTPAMQADQLAGLYLPLKVLAYENAAGDVFLTYEDPKDTLADLNIPADAPYVAMMQGALGKLTAAAVK